MSMAASCRSASGTAPGRRSASQAALGRSCVGKWSTCTVNTRPLTRTKARTRWPERTTLPRAHLCRSCMAWTSTR